MPITDRYLKDPASFPAPDKGEPWGDEELWIDFVGGPYRVLGLSEVQHCRLTKHFSEVCIDGGPTDPEPVRISVRRISPELFQPPGQSRGEISFDLHAAPDHVRVAGREMCGWIDCEDAAAGTLWTAKDDDWFTRNVFENFFRMLVTYHLLERGGLLLHSAGVVSEGQAYLFPGRSGNGKSSLSRLSLGEGRAVLSDDMNAVIWRDGEPWVEKVPFAGDLGRNWSRSDSYPLRAVLALEKSPTNRVRRLEPARAVALMAASAPYLNADSFRSASLLENLEKLTDQVPTHILAFSLRGGIWPVIEEALRS